MSATYPLAQLRSLELLRFISAVMMLLKGTQSLIGFPADPSRIASASSGPSLVGLSMAVVGLLVALGLFTRAAAVLAATMMAFIYFAFHAPQGPVPVVNGGVPAVLSFFIFLHVAIAGPGPWCLDTILRRGSRV